MRGTDHWLKWNQTGSAAGKAITLILTLGLIGFGSWLVWQQFMAPSSSPETRSSQMADETRAKLEAGGRQEATNRRAAIEGTNSALKRGQGLGKLAVCGINKCQVVVGLKVIGRNFQQLMHCLNRQAKKVAKALANPDNNLPDQGASLTC